jgi:hypothetical protein
MREIGPSCHLFCFVFGHDVGRDQRHSAFLQYAVTLKKSYEKHSYVRLGCPLYFGSAPVRKEPGMQQ